LTARAGRGGEGSRTRALLVPALTLAAATALAGCGGAAEPDASAAGACSGRPVASLPGRFPAGLPLPRGFRLAGVSDEQGYVVAEGSAPGSLGAVRDFYRGAFPQAGYELGEGDAEEHEAETEFEGSGVQGRLKLNDAASGCVAVRLAVRRS